MAKTKGSAPSSTKVSVDFGDTESRGGKKGTGGRKHYQPGDYAAKITNAEIMHSEDKGTPGIRVTFKLTSGKVKGGVVSDRFWLSPKALWRVRQLLEACGMKVPSKKVGIDVTALKGKTLAITLDDDEYDEKVYSTVTDTFLLSELDSDDDEDSDTEDETEEEDADEDDDEDEDEEEDDDDEDDLEDEIEI